MYIWETYQSKGLTISPHNASKTSIYFLNLHNYSTLGSKAFTLNTTNVINKLTSNYNQKFGHTPFIKKNCSSFMCL